MTIYGYARVSSMGQTLANQDAALAAAGVAKVYREKVSGVKKRPELERVMAVLKPGDTLIITKLDRLARSARDLLTSSTASARRAQCSRALVNHGLTPQRRLAA